MQDNIGPATSTTTFALCNAFLHKSAGEHITAPNPEWLDSISILAGEADTNCQAPLSS
jgi:hypothetical protein